LYSNEQCLNVALEIITANFPICASKYFKGETWKLYQRGWTPHFYDYYN
jgi:hypothetical protein